MDTSAVDSQMNTSILNLVSLLEPLCLTAAAMEQQDANGLGTGPASPPVSDQSAESPLDSATLLSSGALEEPQNENNNHPRKTW